ncbi:MAG TPA: class I SAM-dependent methyltransferase [Terracidiphilus sp.]|jgi:SAM-dependent methyltransferase
MARQERQRALLRWIERFGIAPVSSKRVLEIGCGAGGNLLELLQLGFRPENLTGNELLPDRLNAAKELLPQKVELFPGDARRLSLGNATFDIVLQSTVFTSILDSDFQIELARRMWTWVAPGGGVLWYDFTFDNPHNPDVKGVPLRRIRELFPAGRLHSWRVTLAPPISRQVTRMHSSLYTIFNAFPVLRTHLLCWIEKSSHVIN